MSIQASEHYTGQRGADYAAKRHSSHQSVGYDLNFDTFRPHINAGDRVLDFGCGNGGMLPRIQSHGAEPEGLEVNPAAGAIAREAGFTVYPALDEIPADRQYDVIVSNHVLEHVRDPSSTLEQVRRFLRPGGTLVLKLPIDDVRAKLQRGWSREDVDHHLHTWTPRLLANTLFEAGYEVESCRIYTSAWHTKLLRFAKTPLGPPAFWLFAILKNRRQLIAVARNPASGH